MAAPEGSDPDRHVIACLKEFRLHRYNRAKLHLPFDKKFIPSNADHCSGGHDDQAAMITGLNFDVRYLLHALVSGNILFFHTRAEAESLIAALCYYTGRVATDILACLFSASPPQCHDN
jgi:hypothetical protein